MDENGQLNRLWKKWGSEFSSECMATGSVPLSFNDVNMAFVILGGAIILVLSIFLTEILVSRSRRVRIQP